MHHGPLAGTTVMAGPPITDRVHGQTPPHNVCARIGDALDSQSQSPRSPQGPGLVTDLLSVIQASGLLSPPGRKL
jgi:hypothetical protein